MSARLLVLKPTVSKIIDQLLSYWYQLKEERRTCNLCSEKRTTYAQDDAQPRRILHLVEQQLAVSLGFLKVHR